MPLENRLPEYVEFVVNLGDSRTILAYGKGTYHFTSDVDGHTQSISLCEVLYLPDLEKNFLSVHAVAKLGATVIFEGGVCKISHNSKVLAVGGMVGKLYVLKIVPDESMNIEFETMALSVWSPRDGHYH